MSYNNYPSSLPSKSTYIHSGKEGFESFSSHQFNQTFTNTAKNNYNFKLILIGDIAVGKTSILNRFVENDFKSAYHCTLGVEYKVKSLRINQNTVANLKIWDTCGEEKYRTITRQYYRDTNGVILVFDLTNKDSFDKLGGWLKDINENGPEDVSVILVGNKSDLKEKKLFLSEEAKRFALQNQMPYVEVSAKLGANISTLFDTITKKIINTEELKFKDDEKDEENNSIVLRQNSRIIKENKKRLDEKTVRGGCC